MKKKSIALLLSLGITAVTFANSLGDARLSFSTKGPDCYADGTQVMDGECYALTWSKDGNFEGFTADGECADPEDRIVLLAPVAKDGRCPLVLFQIPEAEANVLAGGFYAVYLLDTRIATGGETKPAGVRNGKLTLMNGYGEASAKVSAKGSSAMERETASGGLTASTLASVPADCTQPRIKAIRIEGDNVFITVENLRGFMRVRSGSDVSVSGATDAAVETTGGEDVTLVTKKPGNSGFFKVIRNGK